MPIDLYEEREPDMAEALQDVGVDPYATPVDHIPERGLWALVEHFSNMEDD